MFHAEMDSLKSKLENNFENQKKILVTEFNDRLVLEKKELKAEHEKQLIAKDEMLKSDIESLRKEFEIKKKELESNLRSQFTQDITELRAELERAREDSKEKNYHSSRLVFIHLYYVPTYLYFDRNINNFLKNKLIFTGILQAYLQKPIQNLIKIVPVPNLQNQTTAAEVQWF